MGYPESVPAKDFAYYASGWIWPKRQSDLMKSMLLFFDGIALALPADLAAETIYRDPVLATPLAEQGLLVNFDPDVTLDAKTAKQLANTLTKVVQLFALEEEWSRSFATLTVSHFGSELAPNAARVLERELAKRRLIAWTKTRGLVGLDPEIRLLVLTVFSQALRARLLNRGIVVHPVTDSHLLVMHLRRALDYYQADLRINNRVRANDLYAPGRPDNWNRADLMDPSQLSADLLDVGTDLSNVPLDEVLDFRKENGAHYRAYAAALRQFLETQTRLSPGERARARYDRHLQIHDQAAELRRISRTAFGIRASVLLLSLAGASWTVTRGDPFGALLAGLTAATQAVPAPGQTVTAYSYLLRSRSLR